MNKANPAVTAGTDSACQIASNDIEASQALFDEYPDLLTPAHVSELTGFTVQYVRKLCREHKLPAVRIGKRAWFVPKTRFIEYVVESEAV